MAPKPSPKSPKPQPKVKPKPAPVPLRKPFPPFEREKILAIIRTGMTDFLKAEKRELKTVLMRLDRLTAEVQKLTRRPPARPTRESLPRRAARKPAAKQYAAKAAKKKK